MALTPLLAAALAAAAPSAARADNGQVDRLLLALPRSPANDKDGADEAAELARLLALNPGRGEAIKAILDSEWECAGAEERQTLHTILAAVAAQMGPDKTERLISFYASPHYPAVLDLFHRAMAGTPLSAEEKGELERAEAAYPIREFALTMQSKIRELLAAGRATPDYARCTREGDAALDRAGLRRR